MWLIWFVFCELVSRNLSFIDDVISFVVMRNSQVCVSVSCRLVIIEGMIVGSCMVWNSDQLWRLNECFVLISCGLMCCSVEVMVVQIGKKVLMVIRVILDFLLICIQRISSGIQVSEGMVWMVVSVGLSSMLFSWDSLMSFVMVRLIIELMVKLSSMCCIEIVMCVYSCLFFVSFILVLKMVVGVGSWYGLMRFDVVMICQVSRIVVGSSSLLRMWMIGRFFQCWIWVVGC